MRKLLVALLLVLAPAAGAQSARGAPEPVPFAQDLARIAQDLTRLNDETLDPKQAYIDSLNTAIHYAEDSLVVNPDAVVLDTMTPDPRFFLMDDWVREFLATEWRKHETDPYSTERGYCLTYELGWGWNHEMGYHITNITQPTQVEESDVGEIIFHCAPGPFKVELHVHPPSTCNGANPMYCWKGGSDSYECFPSDGDVDHLSYWLVDDKFAALQCDEHAVVYWKPVPAKRKAAILARRILTRWRAAKARP